MKKLDAQKAATQKLTLHRETLHHLTQRPSTPALAPTDPPSCLLGTLSFGN